MSLIDNAVAVYELEADGTDAHSSNDLTNNNATTFTTGKVGNAGTFARASSQSLSIADNAALSVEGNQDRLVACWFKLASQPAGTQFGIVGKYDGSNGDFHLEYNIDNDELTATFYGAAGFGSAGAVQSASVASFSIGTWYCAIFWLDSTAETVNLQVNDGTVDSAGHSAGVFDGNTPFWIGGESGLGRFFDGQVDQVVVVDGTWTSGERTSYYNGGDGLTYEEMGGSDPADKTIWQFFALTAPALVDLIPVVDDPSGTEVTKKVALTDFQTLTVQNVVVQVKTVGSGTYTPTARMKKVLAIAVGGGGGGAGGIDTDSAGGGGGGGGTVIRLMTAADIGVSKGYVVGGGGAATSNGTATTLDAAGALMNAGPGLAATAGAAFTVIGVTVAGGAGGTAANGDLNIPGEPGERGVIFSGTTGQGGKGGRSKFGFGAQPGGVGVAGVVGQAYGGGGSGGHAAAATNQAGAAGADGILYFVEFLA